MTSEQANASNDRSERLPVRSCERVEWGLFIFLLLGVLAFSLPHIATAFVGGYVGETRYLSKAPSESGAKPLLRRWLPQSCFHKVVAVKLENTQVTDAGLAQLRQTLPTCDIHGP